MKDVIARSAVEGASTITQQLAKNVFLSAEKTFFRKATEASIAVALENQMSKQEILTMYLNRIYFGKGIHGVKGAAEFYFDTELQDLELWQAATLAAMPKAPNRYNPIRHPDDSMKRRAVVLKLMYDQGYITEPQMNEAKAVVYGAPEGREDSQPDAYPAFVDYVIDEAIEVTKLSEEELLIGGFHIYTTLNPTAQKALEAAFNDDSNFEESKDEQKAQGAMIIMDHRDGTIQALSGGRDYVKKGLNRVLVNRQPGSVFKPILSFGPALETGMYPWTVLDIDQKCFSNYCPTDRWGPVPVTMKQAMKDSRNLAAVWLLNEVGIKAAFKYAEKLGFELEPEDRNLTAALGGLTKGVTPMQMATAYSVFANDGKSVDPHSILKIEGKNFSYTYKAPPSKQLISQENANHMTDILQSVVEKGGTGTRAAFGRPLAGKTGTTQHGIPGYKGSGNRDAWFVGYTPEWTAAVWMGYDKTDVDHMLTRGSRQAAEMFAKVMKSAMTNVPSASFKKRKEVVEIKPPAAISNLNAVYIPELSVVNLIWDEISEGDITYQVYRKEVSERDYIRFVDTLNTTVDDMGALPGESYEYYVVAYDAKNNLTGERSAIVTVDIPEEQFIPEEPIIDPEMPIIDPGELIPPLDGENTSPPPAVEPEIELPIEEEIPWEGHETQPPNDPSNENDSNGVLHIQPDNGRIEIEGDIGGL